MDAILELLAALLFWRLLICIGIAAILAFGLSHVFSGFTAGYCIALVLAGMVLGVLWHSRAEDAAHSAEATPKK